MRTKHVDEMEKLSEKHNEHESTILKESQSSLSNLKAKLSVVEVELSRVRASEVDADSKVKSLQELLKVSETQFSAAHSHMVDEMKKKYDTKIKELEMEVLAVSRGLQTSDRLKELAEKELADSKLALEQLQFEVEEKILSLEASEAAAEQMREDVASRTKEYDELVGEMQQLKTTLENMAEEREDPSEMKDQCQLLTTNVKKLQDQMRRRSVELQGDIGSVQTQLLAAKKELSRLRQDKEKLITDNSDYQSKLQQLRQQTCAQADELERNAEELVELKEERQMSQCTITDLTAKLSSVEVELSDVCASKTEGDLEVGNLRELLQKSEAQSSALESTVYKLRKEIAELTKMEADKLDAANSDNHKLQESINSLKTQTETQTSHCLALESQIEEYKEKLTAQSSTCETINNRIAEITSDNERLQKQLKLATSESQANVAELQRALSALEAELAASKSTNTSINVELQDITSRLQESDSKVFHLQEELDEKISQIVLLKEKIELSSSDTVGVEELKAKLDISSMEKQQLVDEISSLQSSLTEANSRCDKFAALAMRVKDMNNKLDEHKLLYERATVKISELTAGNASLKAELEASNKKSATVGKLEEQVLALTQEVHAKEKKCESLQVILDARQCEWQSKDNSHESIKQQAEKTEKALNEANEELRTELTSLTAKLHDLKDKLSSQTVASINTEKELHRKVVSLEEELTSVTEELKVAKTKGVPHASPTDNDSLVDQLKAAIEEQEKTMKIQDEVVKSKEDEVHNLAKEICCWRIKYQELSDVELQKTYLSSQLATATHDKNLLQEAHADAVSQMKAGIEKLTSEKSQLEALITEDKVKRSMLEKELKEMKTTMLEWQVEKQQLVAELEKVMKKKDAMIDELQNQPDVDVSKKMAKLEERVARKDRATRARASNSSTKAGSVEAETIQNLEAQLKHEQFLHSETQKMLDRCLVANDEKGADLKAANYKLQKEIQRLNCLPKASPVRRSDRLKEPCFTNDNELSASTLTLDVTPQSSSKKHTKSTGKATRRSTRQSSSAQKENFPSTTKTSTLKKRLQDIVEKSTSPLASPALRPRQTTGAVQEAKRLLQVRAAPLKDTPSDTCSADADVSTATRSTRRRRKLYNVDEAVLSSTPEEESSSAKKARETRSNSSVHSNVLRTLRSSKIK